MKLCLHDDPAPFYIEENGAARVTGTRFPLEGILLTWNAGEAPESIARSFTPLDLEKVYSVIAYYLRHKAELDEYLEEEEREGAELERKMRAQQRPLSTETQRRLAERDALRSR